MVETPKTIEATEKRLNGSGSGAELTEGFVEINLRQAPKTDFSPPEHHFFPDGTHVISVITEAQKISTVIQPEGPVYIKKEGLDNPNSYVIKFFPDEGVSIYCVQEGGGITEFWISSHDSINIERAFRLSLGVPSVREAINTANYSGEIRYGIGKGAEPQIHITTHQSNNSHPDQEQPSGYFG